MKTAKAAGRGARRAIGCLALAFAASSCELSDLSPSSPDLESSEIDTGATFLTDVRIVLPISAKAGTARDGSNNSEGWIRWAKGHLGDGDRILIKDWSFNAKTIVDRAQYAQTIPGQASVMTESWMHSTSVRSTDPGYSLACYPFKLNGVSQLLNAGMDGVRWAAADIEQCGADNPADWAGNKADWDWVSSFIAAYNQNHTHQFRYSIYTNAHSAWPWNKLTYAERVSFMANKDCQDKLDTGTSTSCSQNIRAEIKNSLAALPAGAARIVQFSVSGVTHLCMADGSPSLEGAIEWVVDNTSVQEVQIFFGGEMEHGDDYTLPNEIKTLFNCAGFANR